MLGLSLRGHPPVTGPNHTSMNNLPRTEMSSNQSLLPTCMNPAFPPPRLDVLTRPPSFNITIHAPVLLPL